MGGGGRGGGEGNRFILFFATYGPYSISKQNWSVAVQVAQNVKTQ